MDQNAVTEQNIRVHTFQQETTSHNMTVNSQVATEFKAHEIKVEEKSVSSKDGKYDLPLQMNMKTETVDRNTQQTPLVQEQDDQFAVL